MREKTSYLSELPFYRKDVSEGAEDAPKRTWGEEHPWLSGALEGALWSVPFAAIGRGISTLAKLGRSKALSDKLGIPVTYKEAYKQAGEKGTRLWKGRPEGVGRIRHAAHWMGEQGMGGSALPQAMRDIPTRATAKALAENAALNASMGLGSEMGKEAFHTHPFIGGTVGGLAGGIAHNVGHAGLRSARHGFPILSGSPAEHKFQQGIYEQFGSNPEVIRAYASHLGQPRQPHIEGYQPTTAEASLGMEPGRNEMAIFEALSSTAVPSVASHSKAQLPKVTEHLRAHTPSNAINDARALLHELATKEKGAVQEKVQHHDPELGMTFIDFKPQELGENLSTSIHDVWKKAMSHRKAQTEPLYKQAVGDDAPMIPLHKTREKVLELIKDRSPRSDQKWVTYVAEKMGLQHPLEGETGQETQQINKMTKRLLQTEPSARHAIEMEKVPDVPPSVRSLDVDNMRRELSDVLFDLHPYFDKSESRVLRQLTGALQEDLHTHNPMTKKAAELYSSLSDPINRIEQSHVIEPLMRREDFSDNFLLPRARVPYVFLQGKDSAENSQRLVEILGKDNPYIQELKDFGISELFKKSKNKDGLLDPSRMNQWMEANPGIFSLDPQLSKELPALSRALEGYYAKPKEGGTSFLDNLGHEHTSNARFMNHITKNDQFFDIMGTVERLAPHGKEDLGGAVMEHMLDQITNGGKELVTPHKFDQYMKHNKDTLKLALNDSQWEVLNAAGKTLEGRDAVRKMGQTGQSTTSEKETVKYRFLTPSSAERAKNALYKHTLGYVLPGGLGSFVHHEMMDKAKHSTAEETKGLLGEFLTSPEFAHKTLSDIGNKTAYYGRKPLPPILPRALASQGLDEAIRKARGETGEINHYRR